MKQVRKYIANQLRRLANRISPKGIIYVTIKPKIQISVEFEEDEQERNSNPNL